MGNNDATTVHQIGNHAQMEAAENETDIYISILCVLSDPIDRNGSSACK